MIGKGFGERRLVRLILSPRFRGLFWTQLLGAFTDNFFKQALLILVIYKGMGGGSYEEKTLSLVASILFILPFFLFSATGGQLADKYDKAMVIQRIKLIELTISVLASLGLFLHSVPLLMTALGLLGLQAAFFGPVKYGIIPQLLDPEDLVEGNALVETGTKLAILGGTLAGGLLADKPYAVGACSAVLLVVSVLGYAMAWTIHPVPASDPELAVEWNPIGPTWRVMQMARQKRPVFLSILGISWFWSVGGGLLTLLPVYGKEVLGVEPRVVTTFMAVFSIGVAVGAVLCGKLSFHRLELGLVPFGSLGISLFLGDVALMGAPFTVKAGSLVSLSQVLHSPHGVRILVDLGGIAVCSGLFIVPLYTLIQQRTDEHIRSRVIAANNVLNACFMVVSLVFLAGLAKLRFTVLGMFMALSCLNLLVGLYIYTLIPEFFLRFLAYLVNHVLYRLRVSNGEVIPKQGAALLVGNHISFLDWMVVLGAVHRPVRFVMWHTYYNLPLFRFLFRDAGAIPIASGKSHPEILRACFDSIDQALDEGDLVCIFPEGQLTNDGEIGEFRRGVEQILERRPVSVIPFALTGLWDSLFSRQTRRTFGSRAKRFFRPRVHLALGSPLPPPPPNQIAGLAQKLRQSVMALRGESR
jgi:1-acyl-sn-glycerol-3-phosphate acyltransferase